MGVFSPSSRIFHVYYDDQQYVERKPAKPDRGVRKPSTRPIIRCWETFPRKTWEETNMSWIWTDDDGVDSLCRTGVLIASATEAVQLI